MRQLASVATIGDGVTRRLATWLSIPFALSVSVKGRSYRLSVLTTSFRTVATWKRFGRLTTGKGYVSDTTRRRPQEGNDDGCDLY